MVGCCDNGWGYTFVVHCWAVDEKPEHRQHQEISENAIGKSMWTDEIDVPQPNDAH